MWESPESPEIQLQQQLLGANLNQLSQAMAANQPAAGDVIVQGDIVVSGVSTPEEFAESLYDSLATDVTQGGSNLGFT